MSKRLQLRRGTTAEHSTFTGAVGEVTVDTTKDTAVVHDGSTVGGFPLLKESAYTASDVLTKIKTVDGAASGLDADLLDGQDGSYYLNTSNMSAGTLAVNRGGTGTTTSTGSGSVVLSISPALTGTPTAPTAAVGTNTTQLATTAFVKAAIANDSTVVHKTGDETIAGVKTFSNNAIFNNNVGIGIPNPIEKVDVVGNIRASILYGSRSSASPVAASGLGVAIDGALQCQIVSPASSTMAILTGGAERLRIDSSGNVLVTGSGGLGYGTGSGGTVTQLTSKGTAVTLNKPCGVITMNNSALAAGARVIFQFTNSLLNSTDTLIVELASGISGWGNYRVETAGVVNETTRMIALANTSGSSLAEAQEIIFKIIKGANS